MHRHAPLVLVVLAVAVVAVTLFQSGGYPTYRALQDDLMAQREKNKALSEEVQMRRSEVERLHNDPRTIERAARAQLGMTRPGEYTIHFRDADPGETP